MREIEWTTSFKRDYKRAKGSGRYRDLDTLLLLITETLAADQPLPPRYRDHALGSNWKDHRECHLKPDLLLVYKLPNPATLLLVRLDSHSELFG